MTPDQLKRLEDISERVDEEFLTAADPNNWTGAGMHPTEMDKQTRGDRNWDVKNATQIGALAFRVRDLIERSKEDGHRPEWDYDPEEQVKTYERRASEMLEKIAGRSRGSAH